MRYSFIIFIFGASVINFIPGSSFSNNIFEGDSVFAKDSSDVISNNNSSEKDSTELIIRKLTIHPGKRPSTEKKEIVPEKYWLIKIHFTSVIYASRTIDIVRDGKVMYLPFDPLMSFETAEEAIDYSKKNGIVDVLIE